MPKKQKDNRYRAKITIGHTADGKPIVKYVSGDTKRELEEAKAEARAYFIDGIVNRQDMPFGEYTLQWYSLYKEPNLSESSKSNYRTMLNKHVLPAFGQRQLRAIAPKDIQLWINGFSGMGKSTIDQAATTIKGIFSAAVKDGLVERDPTSHLILPKPAKKQQKRALTLDERQTILRTIDCHKHGLLLAVLYYLGLRRGEALGLMWGDIDWSGQVVHIQRDVDFKQTAEGDLKTEESNRHVFIPQELMIKLINRRGTPTEYVFSTSKGEPLSKASFERMWIELMIDAGIAVPKQLGWKHKDLRAEWDPVITPHYLRHNYVTMLWEGGIDPVTAMRLVGHRDYHTTVQIYTHLDKQHLSDAGEKIDGVFKKVAEKLPDRKNKLYLIKNNSPKT